eukprot:CAMPEP_0116889596 /NCGR_PEP_ID=MMETSP0467-20121206/137_1 /TAXON_ID=283647 /ORGANISM="Mesodinium pulex, Strain SPMC105" /LENGTH=83 /DNA_ID=CAMNT_0004556519 /DNA_START=87 /DNA_END=338 /DNA_ORIENTATION=-
MEDMISTIYDNTNALRTELAEIRSEYGNRLTQAETTLASHGNQLQQQQAINKGFDDRLRKLAKDQEALKTGPNKRTRRGLWCV